MRLTIKVKLIGGFLIVVALLLAVFGIAYNGIRRGDERAGAAGCGIIAVTF